MSGRDLAAWLSYQEQLNPRSIELGLERVRAVWQRLGAARPARLVITVGGTNGKGSSVALLEAMLGAAGLRVGSYTSPHLLRYNERIRVDGVDVGDAALIEVFERIEQARHPGKADEIRLSYFEFGTLAALELFARGNLDVAILEVGLGGRLDAVNIVDPDAVLITTVDLDHQDWLGNDRDSIGREKAGIARAGRPAIIGEALPPTGMLEALDGIGAEIIRAGIAFESAVHGQDWRWRHRDGSELVLPRPALVAPVQLGNAAAVIAVLHALREPLAALLGRADVARDFAGSLRTFIVQGLRQAHVPARLQQVGGDPLLLVDVGHNPQAARALAAWLDLQPPAPLHAVFGALADKDATGVIAALGERVAHWHLAGLEADTPRGLPAPALAGQLRQLGIAAGWDEYADVAAALAGARATTPQGGRILAFGSFYVAAAVLRQME